MRIRPLCVFWGSVCLNGVHHSWLSCVHGILLMHTTRTAKYSPSSRLNVYLHRSADDLAAMWRYYRLSPKYNELRDPKDTIFQGPTFREWALENRDALTAKVNQ